MNPRPALLAQAEAILRDPPDTYTELAGRILDLALEEAASQVEAQRFIWSRGTTVYAQLTEAAERLRALKGGT